MSIMCYMVTTSLIMTCYDPSINSSSSQFPATDIYLNEPTLYERLDNIRDDPAAIGQIMRKLKGNINRDGCATISKAIEKYNFRVLAILLQNDYNFDSKLCREGRPIIMAAEVGNVQAVEMLLQAGACIDCKDRNGLKLKDFIDNWVGDDKKRVLKLMASMR
jgi:hypothetical protein